MKGPKNKNLTTYTEFSWFTDNDNDVASRFVNFRWTVRGNPRPPIGPSMNVCVQPDFSQELHP